MNQTIESQDSIKHHQISAIVLPLLMFFPILFAENLWPDSAIYLTNSEYGLVENLHNVFLFWSTFFAGLALYAARYEGHWLKTWIAIGIIGSFYTFLEEMSYGQHWFDWHTPEDFRELNDQNETNFHNMSSWLDQKPRLILEIGVLVGGIIIPLLRKYAPKKLPKRFEAIYPPSYLWLVAVLAIVPRMVERFVDAIGKGEWEPFVRTSEMQELFVYYFVMLYFIYLWRKYKSSP